MAGEVQQVESGWVFKKRQHLPLVRGNRSGAELLFEEAPLGGSFAQQPIWVRILWDNVVGSTLPQ
jgi:hypothetical protein